MRSPAGSRTGPRIEIQRHVAQKPVNVTFNNQQSLRIERPGTSSHGQSPTFAPQIPARPVSTVSMDIQIRTPQPVVQPPPPSHPPPAPQQPQMSRFSLLSFVSSFEEGKSFNETDLASLGLDLQCDKPLLPMLHSVLSEAPLLDKSCLPVPECYTKIENAGEPREKISLFTDQTLMFIFATQTRTPLQAQAAEELQKRGFVFDVENEKWRMPNGNEWSIDEWREIETHAQQVADWCGENKQYMFKTLFFGIGFGIETVWGQAVWPDYHRKIGCKCSLFEPIRKMIGAPYPVWGRFLVQTGFREYL